MKTPEQILKEKCPGIILFGVGNGTDRKLDAVLEAMEQYAIQKLEHTVASYEIDRVNLVAMTLERDELDEQYKNAVADRDAYRDMYKETIQERDGWISEYRAARAEVERLKLERDELKKQQLRRANQDLNDGLNASHREEDAPRNSGWSV